MGRHLEILDLPNTSKAYYAPATIIAPNTRLVHVCGQAGVTKSGHVPNDYESQIHLALLNLRHVMMTSGARVTDIAKLMIYTVNHDPRACKHTRPVQRFLGGHRPVMTLIPVSQLAVPTWLFEIEALIACPPTRSIPPTLTSRPSAKIYDVVIIGAGLAGLTAAHELSSTGLSCVVLEARDRVGGKTWSQPTTSGRGILELGAGWINDVNQTRMIGLARRFGLELIEQNTTGNCALQDLDGTISAFAYGEIPKFDPASTDDVIRIRDMTEADCQAVDIHELHDTRLDSMTFEAYLRSNNASEKAFLTATVWTRAMLGIDPCDISALFFLNYCKSGGGLLQMRSDRKGGGQHLRIRQGTQSFSKKLAETLVPNTIQLNTVVKQVRQEGDMVDIFTANGTIYRGRKVVTTVPSPVLKTISFEPALHPLKLAWSESASYGYYTKAMMGFCGLAQSFIGPAAVVRDSCSLVDEGYVLTCFMCGPQAEEWAAQPHTERQSKLLAQLGALFGAEDTIEQDFVEMVLYEWSKDEPAGYGCPCAHLAPGVLDSLGPNALREPTGNLHFAGTETAGEWKGYMEGAVRSGERAAKEVIDGLKPGLSGRL
ncbi:hypothetical protein N7454_009507 [Penicillium verhagenii]|nr:hypothetical protein N7454_009507 [Penicillium verhagenii]